jgi:hypothetical protein
MKWTSRNTHNSQATDEQGPLFACTRYKRQRVFLPSLPYNAVMTRDEIIEKLKEREVDLRAQGVAHAALFGSVARGDDRPDSDIGRS